MLNNTGLILNIVGTLLIAFSFSVLDSKNFGDGGSTPDAKGRECEISYFSHPRYFKTGVVLLVLGFIFQLNI